MSRRELSLLALPDVAVSLGKRLLCPTVERLAERCPCARRWGSTAADNRHKMASKILRFKSSAGQEKPPVSRLFDAGRAASLEEGVTDAGKSAERVSENRVVSQEFRNTYDFFGRIARDCLPSMITVSVTIGAQGSVAVPENIFHQPDPKR